MSVEEVGRTRDDGDAGADDDGVQGSAAEKNSTAPSTRAPSGLVVFTKTDSDNPPVAFPYAVRHDGEQGDGGEGLQSAATEGSSRSSESSEKERGKSRSSPRST